MRFLAKTSFNILRIAYSKSHTVGLLKSCPRRPQLPLPPLFQQASRVKCNSPSEPELLHPFIALLDCACPVFIDVARFGILGANDPSANDELRVVSV